MRELILGQENYSPPKGRIHLRRLVFSTKLSPCSRVAHHTFVTVSVLAFSRTCGDVGNGSNRRAKEMRLPVVDLVVLSPECVIPGGTLNFV